MGFLFFCHCCIFLIITICHLNLLSGWWATQGTVLSPFPSPSRYTRLQLQLYGMPPTEVFRWLCCGWLCWEWARNGVNCGVEWTTNKLMELIDFRRKKDQPSPFSVHASDVEIVDSYQYLGIHIDDRLAWTGLRIPKETYRKCQSRLYCLRRISNSMFVDAWHVISVCCC